MNRLKSAVVLTGALVVLLGCGSDGSDTLGELNEARTLREKRLNAIRSDNEFKRYIAKGIQNKYAGEQVRAFSALEDNRSSAASTNSESGYSGTNLIEAGVDEADYIKYDGNYLYTVATMYDHGSADSIWRAQNYLRIFKPNTNDPGVELVQEILMENTQQANIKGLYISTDEQSGVRSAHVLLNSYFYAYIGLPAFAEPTQTDQTDAWAYEGETTFIKFTQDETEQFVEQGRITLSGRYLESRVIDGRLIIASAGAPYNNILFGLEGEEIESKVMDADIESLLPQIAYNQGSKKSAFQSNDCYLPGLSQADKFQPDLLYFASISIGNLNDAKFLCVLSESHDFYASPSSLFVTSLDQETTQIHYITLQGASMSYEGSAEVPGYVRQAIYRLSEHNDALRVISSWQDENDFSVRHHQLTVFSLNAITDQVIQELSRLPNDARPEAIGKPGEDIFAARFFGDKAYIVTFENTDPFYVLDLSNAQDPYIAGELEIPGFSTMLQPLSEALVLGIGRIDRKTKFELFDVSNVLAPQSSDVYEIEHQYSYSEAGWDHHAITLLPRQDSNEVRVTLPITYYDGERHNQLLLFTIGLDNKQFQYNGEIDVERSAASNSLMAYSRSVLDEDKLFFIVDGHLWSSYWQQPTVFWAENL